MGTYLPLWFYAENKMDTDMQRDIDQKNIEKARVGLGLFVGYYVTSRSFTIYQGRNA